MALTEEELSVRESRRSRILRERRNRRKDGAGTVLCRRTRIKRARNQRRKGLLLSAAFMLGVGQLVDMSVASADVTITIPSGQPYPLSWFDPKIILKCSNTTAEFSVESADKVKINGVAWDGGSTTIFAGTDTYVVEATDGKTYQLTGIPDDSLWESFTITDITPISPTPSTTVTDDQQKSPVETRAASVTLLNIGSDFMATQGFEQAANAVALEMAQVQKEGGPEALKVGFTPFAAIGGANLRVNSGSHVDIKSWGINVGFAREVANAQGKLLFGPVVEYGSGSYDSYVNAVSASGNSSFYGLGMLARQQNNDGLYYEGSLRFGRAKSDYSSGGQNYDSSSNYLAGHLGLGKVFAVSKQNTLDTYLKYFYTHQNSDTVTFAGAPLAFDAVDSHRLRIGTRLTHHVNDKNNFYGGLAYQYEFGGDVRATYNGAATPSPSVKGGSGMLELGWQIKSSEKCTLDFNVTGWTGKQRGVTGQLGVNWKF